MTLFSDFFYTIFVKSVKSQNTTQMGVWRFILSFYTKISQIKEGWMEKWHYLVIFFIIFTIFVNFCHKSVYSSTLYLLSKIYDFGTKLPVSALISVFLNSIDFQTVNSRLALHKSLYTRAWNKSKFFKIFEISCLALQKAFCPRAWDKDNFFMILRDFMLGIT